MMVMFDYFKDLFEKFASHNEYSEALVTLATITGFTILVVWTLKFSYDLYKGFRLYFCPQCCCGSDTVEKYGTWAVITGSTDGIGLAMAKELAGKGHSIVIMGRNDEKISTAKALVLEVPNVGEVITIKSDLSDSSLSNLERIKEQLDPDNRDIGIFINNAGIFPDVVQLFSDFEPEFLSSILNINVVAPTLLTKLVIPGMLNRGGGLIINISSIISCMSGPYLSVYGPTKSYLSAFSRQLQSEYVSHPIDIIDVTPGAIHTKLFASVSKIDKPSFLIISPESWAKSCMNAISTGFSSMTGSLRHEFDRKVCLTLEQLGIGGALIKIAFALQGKNHRVAPVGRRHRQKVAGPEVVPAPETTAQ